MVAEMMTEVFFRRFVEFAPVAAVIAAHLWSLLVDATGATCLQVFTAAADQQVPAIAVAVDLDTLV